MGAHHAHRHGSDADQVELASGAVRLLFGFLVICAIGTVIGLVTLWPDRAEVDALRDKAQYAAPGVTFVRAEVKAVDSKCPEGSGGSGCGRLVAEITQGPEKGDSREVGVPPAIVKSGLAPGDQVRLMRIPGAEGADTSYAFDDVVRSKPLWILWIAFVVVVAAVARLRGILALVALGVGGVVLVGFMLPALLSGNSAVGVALAGSAAIMFVVLYLAHGPSVRTSAALAGTLIGVGITAVVGHWAVSGATLSGFADEGSAVLSAFADDLSFRGLLLCALVVAGLGVLNDVTITQTSAVWELRAAGPGLSRRELFTSAMRIGRDHIASSIYTIVFAYAGGALSVLLLISLYDRPLAALLSSEAIAEEIVRTLASGIGLVLAVPITTAIAAFTVTGPRTTSPAGPAATGPGSRSAASSPAG